MTTPILAWNQVELSQQLIADLSRENPDIGRWVNGRIVGLLASAEASTATHFAIGVSALQPGTTTPEHSHAAEELAIIMSGSGTIFIDGESVAVSTGDVVLTPPESMHRTAADPGSPLTVFWIYSQSDSALRWRQDSPVEGK